VTETETETETEKETETETETETERETETHVHHNWDSSLLSAEVCLYLFRFIPAHAVIFPTKSRLALRDQSTHSNTQTQTGSDKGIVVWIEESGT